MLNKKCVIVVDETLPVGIVANTAAVLSISIGKNHPEIVGNDLEDHKGDLRKGITTLPIPILKKGNLNLRELRETLKTQEPALSVVDVINATNTTRSYGEYSERLKSTPIEQLQYNGIALYGDAKLVNKYTGSLGLLR